MKENFFEALKETFKESDANVSVTENGAVGYRSTGKNLLDMNFKIASYRSLGLQVIVNDWVKAYYEDKELALRWLFFAGDIREGLGERRLFRTIFYHVANDNHKLGIELLKFIPEYTRWDYVMDLIEMPEVGPEALKLIKDTLVSDIANRADNKPITLLAKWMPSINTSNKDVRHRANIIRKYLGVSERNYRKTLSDLRKYTNVVEVKMCANQWNEIDYEAVPSKANLRYSAAFMKHDEERRTKYLEALSKGEAKINASVLFPHDIVNKCTNYSGWSVKINQKDETNIALWKALPDYVQGNNNTIVVADGSASMCTNVGVNTKTMALNVANALAIYFAERLSGQFKNKYITFSMRPQLVDLSKGKDIYEKLQIAFSHNECANTNIEAVFDLLLDTAKRYNMTQEDMIDNILIISDMEFDSCAACSSVVNDFGYFTSYTKPDQNLFKKIAKKYENAGYKLPRLVFWNVNSRTGTIPIIENELGVALVSGFSPVIAKMVLSGKTDPYEVLKDQLMVPRYDAIANAAKDLI